MPPPHPSGERECWTCEVEASGELDVASAPAVVTLVTQTAARCRNVTLDLAAVTFMDGAGLDALLAARRSVHRRGGVLRLRSPRPSVRYVIALTGTQDAFDMTD